MKKHLPLLLAAALAATCLAAQAAGVDIPSLVSAHPDLFAGLGMLGFAGSVKTQGSKLFCIDPDTDQVLGVDCMTNFNPGGSPADQLEDTCMEDTGGTRTYKQGLRTPGQATVDIKPDPKNASHVRMFELSQGDSQVLQWALGWSDGTAEPTVDTAGHFDLPSTRTWLTLAGYIADFPFNFQLNTLVEGTVSIQRSGPLAWVPKA